MSRIMIFAAIVMIIVFGLIWAYVGKQKHSGLSTPSAFLVFIATFFMLTGIGGFIFIIVAQYFELSEGFRFLLAIFFLFGVLAPSWWIASKRIGE